MGKLCNHNILVINPFLHINIHILTNYSILSFHLLQNPFLADSRIYFRHGSIQEKDVFTKVYFNLQLISSTFTIGMAGLTVYFLYPWYTEKKVRADRGFWDFVNFQQRRHANGMKPVKLEDVPVVYRERWIKYVEERDANPPKV